MMMIFFHTSMRYWVPQLKTFGDLKFGKCTLFVRFRGASDFDQDVKLSGRVCLNLEFFEKIIKFMKKMND